MTSRPFDPKRIYEGFSSFANWQAKAATAKAEAVAARSLGLKHAFEDALWKALKPYLISYFHARCAYCESNITATDFGHVEHYRPKKAVTDDLSHPGYYWCAYDPSNLLLSCARCNSGDGIGGKKNFFPVATGTRATTEAAVSSEIPVLLNPYLDRIEDHLTFEECNGVPNGFIKGLTSRALESIRIYGLNRDAMLDERLEAQRHSILAFKDDLSRPGHLSKLRNDGFSYPAARWFAIENWWSYVKPARRT